MVKVSASPRELSQPVIVKGDLGTVLRGLVIIAVLLNHYADHFISLERSNLANTMVSVFFVLSGYGIAASLSTKLSGRLTLPKLFSFYRIRVAKVFPLLWIALLIQSVVMTQLYPLPAFLGYGLDGHYWFISSLLECYLLSPFLGFVSGRWNHISLGVMTVICIGSNYLLSRYPTLESVVMPVHFTDFTYMGIYFIHIYLFFLGMYAQSIWPVESLSIEISAEQEAGLFSGPPKFSRKRSDLIFGLLFLVACVYMVLERFFLDSLPFVGSVVLFVITAVYALKIDQVERLSEESKFLVRRTVVYFGRHSLPIYLLHIPFYLFFARVGLIQMDSWLSGFIAIALFPLFLWGAIRLEKLSSVASVGLLGGRGR